MQAILTYAIEFVAIAFALLLSAEFIHGLLPQPTNDVVPPHSWAKAFAPIEELPVYATLDWVKPVNVSDSETNPCVIALAKTCIISTVKQYKLRGESVVRVSDIPWQVNESIRRYKLRNQDVIKLSHLAIA